MEGKRYKNSNYVVYPDGRIWSDSFGGCWKRFLDNGIGYMQVNISIKGIGKKRLYVHRIIAEVFIDNPENKPCVNHKNGDKKDNRVDNLEWVTHRENMNHAIATGLVPINMKYWI